MRLNKKALSAAITLSLVLGVYGVAGATDSYSLFSVDSVASGDTEATSADGVTVNASGKHVVKAPYDDAKRTYTLNSTPTTQGADYTVNGGTWNDIWGGYYNDSSSTDITISSNTVTLENVTVDEMVATGCAENEGTGAEKASGNHAILKGTSTYVIYGGQAFSFAGTGSATAESNTVQMTNGTVTYQVIGGGAYIIKSDNNEASIASGNVVTLKNVTATSTNRKAEVIGGEAENEGLGAGTANNNTVTISGGSVYSTASGYTGYIYGGTAYTSNTSNTLNFEANENKVYLKDGVQVTGNVYGGNASTKGTGTTTANNNLVDISGSTVNGTVYGGYTNGSGTVTGNTVNISGGTITTYESGGKTYGGSVYGGRSSTGTASGNMVMITGGSITGNVYGGAVEGEGNTGTAVNNTVTIANVKVDGSVWGGASGSTASYNTINLGGYTKDGVVYTLGAATVKGNLCGGDVNAHNTLNVFSTGNNVGRIQEDTTETTKRNPFQNMNFYIPASAKGATMLTVTSALNMTGVTNIGIYAKSGTNLNKSDMITLISDSNGITYSSTGTSVNGSTDKLTDSNQTIKNVDISGNDFLILKAKVTAETNAIKAEITDHRLAEASKSPVETQAAGMAMLGMGGDVLAGVGMESAGAAAKAAKADNLGATNVMTPFAVIGGNNTRVNSGSHVDVKSWNLNVGFSKEVKNASGKLLFGPLVEYGNGSYDSYLDSGYHGDGRTNFVGVGFIAKQTNNDNTYYEGSLRAGRLANEYKSTGGNYDESTMYYGLHAGLGKVYQLNANNNIDLFLKAFWVHQNSMDTTLASKDLDMDAVDSFRSKLGFRYNHSFNAKNAMYAGLAWQYEFCGEAEATYDHMAVAENPSLKGHTGILELGWKNNAAKNLELDLGINAYTGVQRGAGANIKLNWKF